MAGPKSLKDAGSIRKFIRQTVRTLERRHKPVPIKNGKPSIEHLVYVICAQRNPERRASAAIKDMQSQFAGWNEVRVSSVLEIADVLRQHDISQPIQKAEQIIHALGRSFGDSKFKLDALPRDRVEDLRVWMIRKLGLPGHVVSDFIFTALGYTKFPIDEATGRVLQRLGLVTGKIDHPRLEKIMSDGLTGRESAHQYRVIEMHASATCLERDPACKICPLLSNCVEGLARKAAADAPPSPPPPPPPPPPVEVKPAPPPVRAGGKPGVQAVKGPLKPVAAGKPVAGKPEARPAVGAAKPGAAGKSAVPSRPARPAAGTAAAKPARPPRKSGRR